MNALGWFGDRSEPVVDRGANPVPQQPSKIRQAVDSSQKSPQSVRAPRMDTTSDDAAAGYEADRKRAEEAIAHYEAELVTLKNRLADAVLRKEMAEAALAVKKREERKPLDVIDRAAEDIGRHVRLEVERDAAGGAKVAKVEAKQESEVAQHG